MICRIIRQQDEMHCSTCGIRWSLDEKRPECKQDKALQAAHNLYLDRKRWQRERYNNRR